MPDIEQFLNPVPGASAAGANLRNTPLFSELEELRRREDPATVKALKQGRDAKTANFKQVIKVAEDVLVSKTKDLQIAVWLTEAWIYRDKVPGLTAGLQLLTGLVDRYWEDLYPPIDDGDMGLRYVPLQWLGNSFDPNFVLRSVELIKDKPFTWYRYDDSRQVGYEASVSSNATLKKRREALIADGKIKAEEFDKEFEATAKQAIKDLKAELTQASDALQELDNKCQEKFGDPDEAPSFRGLRKTLEEISNAAETLLLKRLETDPDPVEAVPAVIETTPEGEVAALAPTQPAAVSFDVSKFEGGDIASPDQAALHVIAAAQFLRQKAPASPISYMLLRALRWGELRAGGDAALTDLPAPPPEIRMTLRAAAGAKNWKQVLQVAEAAMSSPCGRGWLDLQRYAIKACDELAQPAAAKALRSELKCLLQDFPNLPRAVLNDDTGVANPETMDWLKQEGLI